ncbi:hypothetical protein HZA96_05740 [Candidatus Woesearchaeota archaeon]|nr:hypothetical protein [Candidatus Woesearchaeota archaeon]
MKKDNTFLIIILSVFLVLLLFSFSFGYGMMGSMMSFGFFIMGLPLLLVVSLLIYLVQQRR